jgi:cytochrome c-type biogenesis protein
MMQPDLSVLIVFTAGLLSFLSPCVLPLIPGYIAFVAGLPVDNVTRGEWTSRELLSAMGNSALFVLGFTIVFVAMGASATWLGNLLIQKLPLLVNIAGVVIIIFGLQQIGLFKFGFMQSTMGYRWERCISSDRIFSRPWNSVSVDHIGHEGILQCLFKN